MIVAQQVHSSPHVRVGLSVMPRDKEIFFLLIFI
jgi:hypothetical protein